MTPRDARGRRSVCACLAADPFRTGPAGPCVETRDESLLALDSDDSRHNSNPIVNVMDQDTDDFGDLSVPENMTKFLYSIYLPDREVPPPKPSEDRADWEYDSSDGESVEDDGESVEDEDEQQVSHICHTHSSSL